QPESNQLLRARITEAGWGSTGIESLEGAPDVEQEGGITRERMGIKRERRREKQWPVSSMMGVAEKEEEDDDGEATRQSFAVRRREESMSAECGEVEYDKDVNAKRSNSPY
ncbi:hypothetical protein CRG98_009648, partial [Punica granatum]